MDEVSQTQKKVRKEITRIIFFTILSVFMILLIFPALYFGISMAIFSCGEVWAVITGIIIVIAGLTSCVFGIAIYKNQRKK